MKILPYLLAGSAILASSGAAAYTPPQQSGDVANTAEQAEPATDAQQPADAPAETATATQTAFTDAEIESFAAAALKIKALDGDASVTQQQLAEIVSQSGIEPATYVAISKAMQSDPEVAKRVQVAATSLQNKAAG